MLFNVLTCGKAELVERAAAHLGVRPGDTHCPFLFSVGAPLTTLQPGTLLEETSKNPEAQIFPE